MTPDFKTRARSLYESLRNRTKELRDKNGRIRRKGYDMPFMPEQFRYWLDSQFTVIQQARKCRYCSQWMNVFDCSLDHAIPLSRGGAPDLDNIDVICAACNSCKGRMTPEEFVFFRECLMQMGLKFGNAPVNDITRRLESQVKLAQMVKRSAAKQRFQAPAATAAADDGDF